GVAPTLAMDAGNLSKSAGGGTFTIGFVLNLTGGTVTPSSGNIISFTGGGTLGAVTFAPQTTAESNLAGGTFTANGTTFAGPGISRINGGTLTIPSLGAVSETGGTVELDSGALTGVGAFSAANSGTAFVWTGGA